MSLDKLVVQTRSKYGHEYYTCRECNRLRLLNYRKTKSGQIATRRAIIKSTKKYQFKQNARAVVARAIKSGKIKKPANCSICMSQKDIQGHHKNYTKPLEVVWVCRWCHIELDKKQII